MKKSLNDSIKNAPKLSEDEGRTIKDFVEAVIDVLVEISGGKPWFGDKKKK